MRLNRSPRPPSFLCDVLAFLFVHATKRRRLHELTGTRYAVRATRWKRWGDELLDVSERIDASHWREAQAMDAVHQELRERGRLVARRVELRRLLGLDHA